jgi:hypothetical protein
MTADLTAYDKALKTIYRDDLQDDLTYKNNPFLALVPKYEKFSAMDMKFPLMYGNPQSISAVMADAIASAADASSKWAGFLVTRAQKYGVTNISGELIASTRTDQDAFVRALKKEVDSLIKGHSNRLAHEIFKEGWGELAQVGSIAGETVTLAVPSDIVFIEVGQLHQFSSSKNGATLRDSAQTAKVTAVDRQAGTVTYDDLTGVSGVAEDDFIFARGDRQNSATPSRLCLVGVPGWITPSAVASNDSFFGQNRSLDSTRLAGCRQDSAGQPLEEALLDADSVVTREGGALTHFFVSPKKWASLAKAMGSRVRYQNASNGKIGFSSIAIAGMQGDIQVVADRSVPENRIFGVTMDTLELASDGKLVRLIDDDGMTMLRSYNSDAVEVRTVSRAQLLCHAPSHNIAISL